MTVKPRWAGKRRHKFLLGVFVLLGLLAGAGYAVQKLTSTIVMKRIVDDRPYPTQPPPEGTHHRA